MRLSKRILKSELAQRALARLAAAYVRAVARTTRWQVEVEPAERLLAAGESAIAAFWHGRLLMMPVAWRWRGRPVYMMISWHRDGALIARTIAHFGLGTVGSDSRTGGRTALRQMARRMNDGAWVGITPDGPRGPRMRAKAGAVKLAQFSGCPLVPVSVAVSRRRVLGSWDRFQLALPFGCGIIRCGEPIRVPRDADAATVEAARAHLEKTLNDLTADLDRRCGVPAVEPEAGPADSAVAAEPAATVRSA